MAAADTADGPAKALCPQDQAGAAGRDTSGIATFEVPAGAFDEVVNQQQSGGGGHHGRVVHGHPVAKVQHEGYISKMALTNHRGDLVADAVEPGAVLVKAVHESLKGILGCVHRVHFGCCGIGP